MFYERDTLDGQSPDKQRKIFKIKALFSEIVTEAKVDFENYNRF